MQDRIDILINNLEYIKVRCISNYLLFQSANATPENEEFINKQKAISQVKFDLIEKSIQNLLEEIGATPVFVQAFVQAAEKGAGFEKEFSELLQARGHK